MYTREHVGNRERNGEEVPKGTQTMWKGIVQLS